MQSGKRTEGSVASRSSMKGALLERPSDLGPRTSDLLSRTSDLAISPLRYVSDRQRPSKSIEAHAPRGGRGRGARRRLLELQTAKGEADARNNCDDADVAADANTEDTHRACARAFLRPMAHLDVRL